MIMLAMETIGRYLIFAGLALLLIGGAVFLAGKFDLPLGRLPGDIRVESENSTFYFPLATGILLSVVLTVLFNLMSFLGRFLNR